MKEVGHMISRMNIGGVEYKIMFCREEIIEKVSELAKQIAEDFKSAGKEQPILMFVLTGGLYFGIDISRSLSKIGFEHSVDTVGLKRFVQDEHGGVVQMISSPHAQLGGRDVIVVEDIIDQGLTMNFLNSYLLNQTEPPRSVVYCTLFLKTNHEPLDFEVKYLGWTIGPAWVIGNGMDSGQAYRGKEDVLVKV